MKVAIRYSEAFKRQVVKELEGGNFGVGEKPKTGTESKVAIRYSTG